MGKVIEQMHLNFHGLRQKATNSFENQLSWGTEIEGDASGEYPSEEASSVGQGPSAIL